MFCRNCGKKIPDESENCPICGCPQSITEIEYRTGARSRAGAAVLRFQEEPYERQAAIALELLGLLLGTGGILFAALYPGSDLTIGIRAVLVMLGGAILLGFGIALCSTLAKCRKPEV